MAITISAADGIGASGTASSKRTKKFAVRVFQSGHLVAQEPATPSGGKWSVKWTAPLGAGDYVAEAGTSSKTFTVAGAPPPPPPPPPSDRLYPTSPFWKPADTSALDPNSANFVASFLAQGAWAAKPQGTEFTQNDWTRPFYVAKTTDPVHTIQGGLGGSWTEPSIQGDTIHVPAGARPAGGQYWQQLDGGLVIQQPDGRVYSAWRSVDPVDGRAYQWAMIDGTKNGVPSGSQAGIGQAKLGPRQGQVTYDELVTAGKIEHALFAEIRSWHRRDWPGWPGDAKDSSRGGYTSDSQAPPMGGHLYLAYTGPEIDALPVPPWKKVILRAMATFGIYTYDNGGSAHSLDWESGIPSILATGTNRWTEWAKAQGIPGHTDSTGHMIYAVDIQSGVDWTRLRVLKPAP